MNYHDDVWIHLNKHELPIFLIWSFSKRSLNRTTTIDGRVLGYTTCIIGHPQYSTNHSIDALLKQNLHVISSPSFVEIANTSLDIYRQIYPQNTNVTFTVVITDGGTPTRGTTADVTYELSNTCILDTWFNRIPGDQTVDVDTGEIRALVPGYYSEPFGIFYILRLTYLYLHCAVELCLAALSWR